MPVSAEDISVTLRDLEVGYAAKREKDYKLADGEELYLLVRQRLRALALQVPFCQRGEVAVVRALPRRCISDARPAIGRNPRLRWASGWTRGAGISRSPPRPLKEPPTRDTRTGSRRSTKATRRRCLEGGTAALWQVGHRQSSGSSAGSAALASRPATASRFAASVTII